MLHAFIFEVYLVFREKYAGLIRPVIVWHGNKTNCLCLFPRFTLNSWLTRNLSGEISTRTIFLVSNRAPKFQRYPIFDISVSRVEQFEGKIVCCYLIKLF